MVYREEEREVIPLSLDQGIGIIPWSPLARGFLAGNRSKESYGETLRAKTDEFAHNLYYQDSDFQIADRVVELAQKRGVKPTQIALAWLLHQPGVTAPIVGASKIEHLKKAVEAVDLKLSDEERKFLEEPLHTASHLRTSVPNRLYQSFIAISGYWGLRENVSCQVRYHS